MERKEHTPHDYSVDEILAETRGRFGGKSYEELIGEEVSNSDRQMSAPSQPPADLPQSLSKVYPFDAPPVPTPAADSAVSAASPQKQSPASAPSQFQEESTAPQSSAKEEASASAGKEESWEELQSAPAIDRKKQEKKGFWAKHKEKKKKRQGFDETEDIYYGLQLKGIDEYRRGYNDDDAQQTGPTPAFAYLFDDTQDADVDEEIAQRFEVIHRERQKRAQQAGLTPIGRRDTIYSYSDEALGAADNRGENKAAPIAFSSQQQKREVSAQTPAQPPQGRTIEFRMPDRLKNREPIPLANKPRTVQEPENFDVDQILSERGFPVKKEESSQQSSETSGVPTQQPKPSTRKPKKLAVTSLPKELPKAAEKTDVPQEAAVIETSSAGETVAEGETAVQQLPAADSVSSPVETAAIENAGTVEETSAAQAGAMEETSAAQTDTAKALPESDEEDAPENPEPSEKEEQKEPEQQTARKQMDPAKEQRRQKISALIDAIPPYHPYGKRVHILDVENLQTALDAEMQSYMAHTSKKRFLTNIPDAQVELGEEPPQKKNAVQEVHTSRQGGKFALFGEEEAETPTVDVDREEEELDDYNQPSDAPSVSYELKSSIRKILLRTAITGIFTVFLLALDFLFMNNLFFPAVETATTTLGFLITNLVFLVAAIAFCMPAFLNGWKGLVTLHANSDSSVSVVATAALMQSVAQFFDQGQVVAGQSIQLYSVLAVGALLLNTVGKLVMVRRISRNFQFVANSDQKYAVEIYDDHNTALQMAKGCVVDAPCIAYQRKAGFLKGFLRSSYEIDPSEQASQVIAPIGLGLSIILCAVVAVLTKDAISAITAFAAGACISTPVANMLCVNLPVSRLCRLARRCGTMVTGSSAIEQFSSVNAAMLDAKDLFPKGTVVLNGIKTFGDGRIDDAIIDASAVMSGIGGPLSDLFDQILKTAEDLLPKASNISYEDGRGVVGWVDGRRILVGSRDLLAAHGVEPPERDYEKKYLVGGKQVIYLASGGKIMAAFILTYNSDKRRALELQRMESNGISLIVRTTDPNIKPELLAQCFRLDPQSVRVLPQRLGDIYNTLVEKPVDKVEAAFASRGRPTAMMRLLTACVRQKGNISLAVALQNIGLVIGFVLVAFLACFSGLDQLTLPTMLLYELFWLLVILFIPRLRKP